MANNSIGFHEWICLRNCVNRVSIFKIMVQEILTYIALAIALLFLYQKFFGKKKPKKNCGNDDCSCN